MSNNQVVIENINNVVVIEDNGIGERRLLTIVEEPKKTVNIDEEGIRIVQVGSQGPPGAGIPQRLMDKLNTYIHNQAIPSAVWTINHNLQTFPSVTAVDSAGEEMIMEVTYIDYNTLTCKASGPIAGKAYLN
jgi:hypothetical protein